jgi:hypothetical protein
LTHYVIDRREPLKKLLCSTWIGKTGYHASLTTAWLAARGSMRE